MGQPPLLTQVQKQRQYFLGLGLGLIPLMLFLTSFALSIRSSNNFFVTTVFVALGLYVAQLIATIVCLVIDRIRFVGYGLLTLFLASPVIGAAGCIVITNLSSR
jgi:hypothetical protein